MTDFYNEHKDKEIIFPPLPEDVDPHQGFHVAKWYLEQMIKQDIGWINLAVRSVNSPEFIPLGQDYRGRIELEKIEQKFPGRNEVFLATNGQYRPATTYEVPYTREWWETRFPSERFGWIKYEFLDAESSIEPRQDKEYNINNAFDFLDDALPILCAVRMPGKDCKLVVENCGSMPMIEGGVYLINPRYKYQIINESKTTRAGYMTATARLGLEFQRFCDMIARSYFVQVNSNKYIAERQV